MLFFHRRNLRAHGSREIFDDSRKPSGNKTDETNAVITEDESFEPQIGQCWETTETSGNTTEY